MICWLFLSIITFILDNLAYEELSDSPIKGKRNSTDKSNGSDKKRSKKNDTSISKTKVKTPINDNDDNDDGNETDEQEIPTIVISKGKNNDKEKSSKATSSSKSKNDESNASISSKSKSKSSIDTSNDKKAKEKAKAYYPTVDYELSASILKTIKDKSDKDKLSIIINDIVSVEKKALESSFKTRKETGQQAILKSMLEVLNLLPSEIESSCPDNVQFVQEKTTNQSEKKEINALSKTLSALQAQSSSLSKYENDIVELFKSYDLWIEPPAHTSNSDNNANVFKEESEQFETLLSDMEKNCQRVLNEANDMSTLMSTARQIQEKLYNTYQKARLIPSVGTSNPKDILKTLQHM